MIALLQFVSLFLIMLSLQGSHNVAMIGLGKEYRDALFLVFITGICLFGLSI